MQARRRFLSQTAALGLAMLPLDGYTHSLAVSSLIRSRPNPDMQLLSLSAAETLCDMHEEITGSGDFGFELDLSCYRSATINALECLAQKQWAVAYFGFPEITEDMSIALAAIQAEEVCFSHIESIQIGAMARICGRRGLIGFKNVLDLNTSGFQPLVEAMSVPQAYQGDRRITFQGDFHFDPVLQQTLAKLPAEVSLVHRRHRQVHCNIFTMGWNSAPGGRYHLMTTWETIGEARSDRSLSCQLKMLTRDPLPTSKSRYAQFSETIDQFGAFVSGAEFVISPKNLALLNAELSRYGRPLV